MIPKLKFYPHVAFTDILAAHAAGHRLIWRSPEYRLTGTLDDLRIGDACCLFCDDGSSIYDPAEFMILPPGEYPDPCDEEEEFSV